MTSLPDPIDNPEALLQTRDARGVVRLTLKQEGGLEKLMEIVTQTLIRVNQEMSRRV